MNKSVIFITILVITFLLGALVAFDVFRTPEENLGNKDGESVACTADATMCPDGSYLGRSGPKCEFVCPTYEINGVGILSGQVTLSPTCPVERFPADPNCAPKAFVTDVTAVKDETLQIVAETRTTSDGNYVLDLSAGMYVIRAKSGGVFPICEDKKITIKEGERVILNISCDSGIR